jgi:hypothetical protein
LIYGRKKCLLKMKIFFSSDFSSHV